MGGLAAGSSGKSAGSSQPEAAPAVTLVTLRSHLASVLRAAGGPQSLTGRRVWTFWYADVSKVEWDAVAHGQGAGGGSEPSSPYALVGSDAGAAGGGVPESGDGRIKRSPVRGNWYEAVVLSVDPQDSTIKVG